MSSDSRQDARAIAAAIASHAEAIEGYALDPSVTDEVFEHEMLGRAHLIEARLGRLRKAVQADTAAACTCPVPGTRNTVRASCVLHGDKP